MILVVRFARKQGKIVFKVIKYENQEGWMLPLSSAKSHIPTWYKNMPADETNFKKLPPNNSVKSCVPFIDSLTSGYMLELQSAIAVELVNGNPSITWADGSLTYVKARDKNAAPLLPTPTGYFDGHFVWETATSFLLPNGYTILMTHPFNRFDLPFLTVTGVIDADSVMGPGNMPFFIKEGFEGLIPAGTPIAQILPFKRENWKSKEEKGLFTLGSYERKRAVNTVRNYYRKNSWKKKSYE
jgi:hypothetical protein